MRIDSRQGRGVIVLGLLLSLGGVSHADTLYLRRGAPVSGKIIEENKYYIKMEVNGRPVTYVKTEIDKIERESDKKQEAAQAQQAAVVSPEKQELISRLLEANGAREHMNKVFAMIISQAPEARRDELKGVLKTDEIITRLVPIYAKYYSDAELKDLITFYKSPTGIKHLQSAPKVVEESMVEAIKYFQAKVAEKGL